MTWWLCDIYPPLVFMVLLLLLLLAWLCSLPLRSTTLCNSAEGEQILWALESQLSNDNFMLKFMTPGSVRDTEWLLKFKVLLSRTICCTVTDSTPAEAFPNYSDYHRQWQRMDSIEYPNIVISKYKPSLPWSPLFVWVGGTPRNEIKNNNPLLWRSESPLLTQSTDRKRDCWSIAGGCVQVEEDKKWSGGVVPLMFARDCV